jgi:hypothetical protein
MPAPERGNSLLVAVLVLEPEGWDALTNRGSGFPVGGGVRERTARLAWLGGEQCRGDGKQGRQSAKLHLERLSRRKYSATDS